MKVPSSYCLSRASNNWQTFSPSPCLQSINSHVIQDGCSKHLPSILRGSFTVLAIQHVCYNQFVNLLFLSFFGKLVSLLHIHEELTSIRPMYIYIYMHSVVLCDISERFILSCIHFLNALRAVINLPLMLFVVLPLNSIINNYEPACSIILVKLY